MAKGYHFENREKHLSLFAFARIPRSLLRGASFNATRYVKQIVFSDLLPSFV